jgi:hypothetical protein
MRLRVDLCPWHLRLARPNVVLHEVWAVGPLLDNHHKILNCSPSLLHPSAPPKASAFLTGPPPPTERHHAQRVPNNLIPLVFSDLSDLSLSLLLQPPLLVQEPGHDRGLKTPSRALSLVSLPCRNASFQLDQHYTPTRELACV